MFRRGFTLIGLLVVIAIIAILIGLLLPALASARDAARTGLCLVNIRSVGQGLTMYADERRGIFPGWSAWQLWEGDGTGGDAPGPGWTEQLADYLDTKEIYRDPSRPAELAPFGYFLQSRYTFGRTGRLYTSLAETQVVFGSQFVLAGDCNNRLLYASPYGTTNNGPDCDQDDATQPAVFFTGELSTHGPRKDGPGGSAIGGQPRAHVETRERSGTNKIDVTGRGKIGRTLNGGEGRSGSSRVRVATSRCGRGHIPRGLREDG